MPANGTEHPTHHELIAVETFPASNSTATALQSPQVLVVDSSSSLGTPPLVHSTKKQRVSAAAAENESDQSQTSQQAVLDLETFLNEVTSDSEQPSVMKDQPFASLSLTASDAQRATELLWNHHVQKLKTERATEIANQEVTVPKKKNGATITMKYFCKIYHPSNSNTTSVNNNKMPLFIGLHGGGGCPAPINDQQWENHKRIYQCAYQALADQTQEPLLYVAPRAPTNNWNLWHEPHMDLLLDRLIANLTVHYATTTTDSTSSSCTIDTNRVYISGYSAGGDGIYMLAPRMADRWAAASMMAGHPNGVSLRGVYNLPFSLHVGGKDDAYNRNQVAREYKQKLEQWQEQEQEDGYQHIAAQVYDDKGHWLGDVESPFIGWMAQHKRNANPETVVWDSGSARHDRFYWVLRHEPPPKRSGGGEVCVTRSTTTGSSGTTVVTIDLTKCPRPQEVGKLTLRFSDDSNSDNHLDCDNSPVVEIHVREKDDDGSTRQRLLQKEPLCRTIATLRQTLQERGDLNGIYSAQVTVDVSRNEAAATGGSKPKLRGSQKQIAG
ncbi:Domain of unknown function (DUF1083) [Seminavis robusta]|uniref:Uncharacterized protein n=1 Tax=Seminavis robusta TaxID=568900 RepID=A0A9N8DHI3_9STRA|nr:Domain of unknown function (DUF1083) [Seminavis robusta]|eukprot:Sro91_g047620.1 Domain of unknown function (DUF1083) (553) ;mRNA; f:36856-38514